MPDEEIPTAPTVVIAVDRGHAYVNGAHVAHPSGTDPEAAALALVASEFAGPLGRPVRATLTTSSGHRRIAVAPNGDVLPLEPAPETPRHGRSREVPAAVAYAYHPPLEQLFRPPRDEAAPVAGAHRASRRIGFPATVATSLVSLLAAAAVGAALIAHEPPRHIAGLRPPAAIAPDGSTDEAPALVVRPASMLRMKSQRLAVSAAGGVGSLGLRIVQLQRPARAAVTVTDSSGAVRRERLAVVAGQVLTWSVPAGVTRWSVAVPGAPTVRGTAVVEAYAAPSGSSPAVSAPTQRPGHHPVKKGHHTHHPKPDVPTVPVDPDLP